MASLIVTTREGDTYDLAATSGLSVMEIAREGGVDELLAACGGCLSCATCHVVVDSSQAAFLSPASDDEEDLLDGLTARVPTSRLACQIQFEDRLDGLRVTIAPEA
jgi:2Fe-2S ferredoxin